MTEEVNLGLESSALKVKIRMGAPNSWATTGEIV